MKRKTILLCAIFAAAFSCGHAQNYKDIKIWPGNKMPNSNVVDQTQPFDDSKKNYDPTIRVYLPPKEKATGQAVLCIPGGGYGTVCYESEGYHWTQFTDHGIALIVLKYRLPFGNNALVPSSDAFEAMRIIRRNAKEWNIDPHKVGVMGHSAGGHLAATVAIYGIDDARPDFQILFYPVITMDKRYTDKGTHDRLIGENASKEMEQYFSCEKSVKAGNPPAIILTTDDDAIVPSENSVNYYQALRNAGVSASLHIYPSGSHGFSNHKEFRSHNVMINDLFTWLEALNK